MHTKLPTYRTEDYTIWRSCERMGILPEGVRKCWEDNTPWTQASLIAFEQIREYEEMEERAAQWLSSQV